MSYRCNPANDTPVVPYREHGHGPRSGGATEPGSALLIDATMKQAMPPVALPKREYMERAKALWEKLGLPALKPEAPWFGCSLGDGDEEWDKTHCKRRAVSGWTAANSTVSVGAPMLLPNTSTRITDGE